MAVLHNHTRYFFTSLCFPLVQRYHLANLISMFTKYTCSSDRRCNSILGSKRANGKLPYTDFTVLQFSWVYLWILAGSALLGPKAAMACTVAVESVIVDHYNDQLRTLMSDPDANRELLQVIQKFRDEEQEHHDAGIDHGAENAPFYKVFTEGIKLGCRAAIAISKVIWTNISWTQGSSKLQHSFNCLVKCYCYWKSKLMLLINLILRVLS